MNLHKDLNVQNAELANIRIELQRIANAQDRLVSEECR